MLCGNYNDVTIPTCGKRKRFRLALRFPLLGITVLDMANNNQAVKNIRRLITTNDRSYAWLARVTEIPYKRILAEVKNESRPISLETAVASASAFQTHLPELLQEAS